MRHGPRKVCTLADVAAIVAVANDLPRRRRMTLLFSIGVAERLVGRARDSIVADADLLRRLKHDFGADDVGVSPKYWIQIRSYVHAALVRAGCVKARPPGEFRTGPGWEPLRTELRKFDFRRRLWSLIRYCSERGIAPDRVDEAVLEAAADWISARGTATPRPRVHYELSWSWNRAVTRVPGWPNRLVEIPDRRQAYVLPWETFPASFKADTDAYLKWMAGRSTGRTVRLRGVTAATRESYLEAIRQSATALVRRGRDPQRITRLADLVEPSAVTDILRFHVSRGRDRSTPTLYTLVSRLRVIARDWVGADKAHLEALGAIMKRLLCRRRGLSNGALAELHVFEDPATVERLFAFPRSLMERAIKHDYGRPEKARQAQTAAAIELLLVCPVKLTYLACLKLGRDVQLDGQPRRVCFPRAGSYGTPLSVELPAQSAELLEAYVARFRPRLLKARSAWFFPGIAGRAKTGRALSVQISATIRQHVGLAMTPRTFRHLGAKLFLARNPAGYEVLRRVLGLRSAKIVQAIYGCLDGPRQNRLFDERILEIAALTAPPTTLTG